MSTLVSDLRLAVRTLRQAPGVVIVSVLSLGLGLGANLTLFSAVRAVFFYTPAVLEADRIVGVEAGNSNQYSYLNYRDLRDSQIFEALAGFRPVSLNARAGTEVERLVGFAVTGDFFDTLGARLSTGRTFGTAEAAAEREPRIAVISHRLWQRQFGLQPITGKTLTLNGESFNIIGVLAQNHRSLSALTSPDVYVPLSAVVLPTIRERSNANALGVLARLRPGSTREQAQTAVTSLGQRLEALYPVDNAGMGQPATVLPLAYREFGGWQEPAVVSGVLMSLVGLLLISACANVAGLLLARAARRQREIALRMALGAHRSRLARMLLAESVALALAGAAAGGMVFLWLASVLTSVALPLGGSAVDLALRLDTPVLLYGCVLTAAIALLCGVAPAVHATHADLTSTIKSGDTHGTTGRLRLRHTFVVGQVAVSLMLLVLSSLLLRSLVRMATLDPGFDVARVAVAMVHVSPASYAVDGGLSTGERFVQQLAGLSDVEAASFTNIIALGTDQSASPFQVADAGSDMLGARTYLNSVSPGYFATMGIPFVAGRDFDARDRAGSPPVAIVSEAFARAYFPSGNALGQRVRRSPREPYAEIVGVVRDSKYGSIAEAPVPLHYTAYAQQPQVSSQTRPLIVHARSRGDAAALLPDLRRIAAALEPAAAVDVRTLRDATGGESDLRTFGTRVLGALGAVALLLAMVGLYGVMAFVVSSRTSEIGTRMALGASANRILWNVVGQGFRLVGVGMAIGALGAWLVSRVLIASLAGLSPADPIAFGSAVAVLAIVALAACYVPARRAASLNPVAALRVE